MSARLIGSLTVADREMSVYRDGEAVGLHIPGHAGSVTLTMSIRSALRLAALLRAGARHEDGRDGSKEEQP